MLEQWRLKHLRVSLFLHSKMYFPQSSHKVVYLHESEKMSAREEGVVKQDRDQMENLRAPSDSHMPLFFSRQNHHETDLKNTYSSTIPLNHPSSLAMAE